MAIHIVTRESRARDVNCEFCHVQVIALRANFSLRNAVEALQAIDPFACFFRHPNET